MIFVSLLVNIVVLAPVIWGLWTGSTAMEQAFGADTPARRILTCVYLAILLFSAACLVGTIGGLDKFLPATLALLTVQVVYKIATVAAVGLSNPVIQANLAIVAIHVVTIVTYLLAPSPE